VFEKSGRHNRSKLQFQFSLAEKRRCLDNLSFGKRKVELERKRKRRSYA